MMTTIAQQTSLAIENYRLTQDRIKDERLSATGEMVSSVVHEIKNSLSSIQIYTELLENLRQDDVQKEYCQVILSEISRVLDITNKILDYGQNIKLSIDEINLNLLIGDVMKIIEQHASKKNIRIKKNLDPKLTKVRLDQDKMKQVIFNIALNALQIMPEKGILTISTSISPMKKHYKISIADTGPGIQEHLKNQIFQPFFSNRKGGIGLGLSISQRIVQEHQGRIQVDAEIDYGSIFHIELPFAQAEIPLPLW